MKLRNQLLAFCCLLVFAAFGFLYVRTWVVPKTFGIILFVSDGMVVRHLTAGRLYEGGADHRLYLESLPNIALLRNPAREFAVPDAAAAATALATGVRVGHRQLSIDPSGKPLATILELAHAQGRAVGLITMNSPLSPTPAAFYAHTADAHDSGRVLQQFLEPGKFDVVFCGGAGELLPAAKGGHRQDGRDILAELQGKGWELVRSKAELDKADAYRTAPLAGFFADGQLAFSNQIESGSRQPSLKDMVGRAIEFLQVHGKGYVLVVDAGLVTTAAERNEGEHVITETLALDHAVATAAKYAGEKSLILAVGKHATGGFSLNGYPLVPDHGVALLGINPSGQPAITWATGPNGPGAKSEPGAFQTPSALNTAEDVMAVGRGAGAERLRGFMDNTEVFNILKDAL
jgi:alkaline phosphatase